MTGFGPDDTVEIRDRRARAAVAVLFLSNGAPFAGLLPRYREIEAQVGFGSARVAVGNSLLTSLRIGLLIVPVAGLVIAVCAAVLRPSRVSGPSRSTRS